MTKRTSPTVAIDPMLKGREGYCVVCEGPIAQHFDGRNRWKGCPAVANPDVQFLLVPDRRATAAFSASHKRQHSLPPYRPATAADYAQAAPAPVPAPSLTRTLIAARDVRRRPHTQARVLYRAKYGIRDPKVKAIGSDRDRAVFVSIARAKRGVSRIDLLKLHRASTHTGIVDGAVRRLRLRKLIETVVVSE